MRRFTGQYADDGKAIRLRVRQEAGDKCIRCSHPNCAETHHVLTVHHFDGNKANDAWWNLMALCQRCHLKVQGKVDPEIPYFLEHSEWAKPYIAGFYAHKYEGRMITREEAVARMDELLAYELA
jgi:5-methylcytosine-specific restriction endonuclease McrA